MRCKNFKVLDKLSVAYCCLLAGIVVLMSSCGRPYTYVSNTTCFPANATWQTASYAVGIRADGESGKRYSDIGDKHVFVKIYHSQGVIMQKEYVIKAGDLNWKVHWSELPSLQILFSEYGDTTNIIRTITFKIDPSTNQAVESN